MKAVEVSAFGPAEVLQVCERADPSPGADDVLIQVARSGVNFAEVNARWGRYPERTPVPPFVPGAEVAGRVVEVGQRVAAFTRGGSYAELAVASAAHTFALPDAVDWDQAAALPIVGVTAHLLLTSVLGGRLAAGERVLIHAAAGGVGTTAIQIARIAGAGRVLGTAGGPDKVAYAKSLGADEVFDYRAGDFGPAVLATTGGRGVDLVLDAVGGEARRQSLAVLAHEGRHVLFGNASAQPEMDVSTRLLRDKQLTITGFHLTAVRTRHPELVRAAVNDLLAWLVDGRLRFCVTEVLPLGRAADAHRLLETRQSRGKLLLAPSEP